MWPRQSHGHMKLFLYGKYAIFKVFSIFKNMFFRNLFLLKYLKTIPREPRCNSVSIRCINVWNWYEIVKVMINFVFMLILNIIIWYLNMISWYEIIMWYHNIISKYNIIFWYYDTYDIRRTDGRFFARSSLIALSRLENWRLNIIIFLAKKRETAIYIYIYYKYFIYIYIYT